MILPPYSIHNTTLKHTQNSQQPPIYCPTPITNNPQPHAIARNETGNQNTTPTGSRFAICPKKKPPPVLKRHPPRVQASFVSDSLIKLIVSF